MEIIASFVWAFGMWIIVQLIRLAMADCDLTLQWAAKFGRKPSKLIGKVVWITGASSGIGEYLAYEFAKAQCLLVLSARTRDELERVKARCISSSKLGEDDVLVLPLDVTKFDRHADAVVTVLDKFNRIDILVNNAGRGLIETFDKLSLDQHRDVFNLNALGPIMLTRAVLPHMYENKRGQIAVMSSVTGKMGVPGTSSYCAAKHALHGAFESLRCESHKYNVSVTMLCPGRVNTDGWKKFFSEQDKDVYGKISGVRMNVERCAFLCTAAITNKINEAWICLRLELLGLYIMQYAPSYGKRLMIAVMDRIFSMKDKK